MNKQKLLIGLLSMIALVSAMIVLPVRAADITDAQRTAIRNNCTDIKNTLVQIHSSDALLRVNMGQVYESLSTRLMANFNTRLGLNNFNNSGLTIVTANYNQSLDVFRNDYKTYELSMSALIDIDCANKPDDFYNALTVARTNRSIVYNDIKNLNSLIDSYSQSVGQFKDYYKSLSTVKAQ